MAEKRKLLNEIDKCFKKIEEGVELFEETMAKMQEANSENQREKFQDDLKKEIKKLQRLRDQIKGWQNSSDIKDKDKLTHYRKVIEQRMEQFKDVERENKTKPHSKQGLSAEEKLDPKEKEKANTVEWLQSQIRLLEGHSDKTESQIESLATTEQTRKKGKRDDPKKGEKEKLKKMDDLRKHLERIKSHVSKLEICMRLVNNETLESKAVIEALKEQFEIYIESLDPDNDNDPETYDPEAAGVYDELNLQSYTPQLGGVFAAGDSEDKVENGGDVKTPSSVSPTPPLPKEMDDVASKQRHSSGDATLALTRQSSVSRSTPTTPLKLTNQLSVESSSLSSPPPATPPPPQGMPYNVAAGLGTKTNKGAVVQSLSKPRSTESVRQQQQQQSSSVISITTTTTTSAPLVQKLPVQQPSTNDENSNLSSQAPAMSPLLASGISGSSTLESSLIHKRFSISSNASSQQEVTTLKPMVAQASSTVNFSALQQQSMQSAITAQQGISNVAAPLLNAVPPSNLANPSVSTGVEIDPIARQVLRMTSTQENRNQQPQTAMIPAWLGASPLGRAPPSPEHDHIIDILEHAVIRTPLQMDSEKPRSYLPKMPCTTAPYYPQVPPANSDTLEYYLRLTPESLFFAFYYMEGSRAQLLAAKALKKLSWRFHTKYLMWFQRHEEPKQITDDYEQGTYVYFDFEKWSQRKKEQFTFEYRYLEDREFD